MHRTFPHVVAGVLAVVLGVTGAADAVPIVDPILVENVSFGQEGPPGQYAFHATGIGTFLNINEDGGPGNVGTVGDYDIDVFFQDVLGTLVLTSGSLSLTAENPNTFAMEPMFQSNAILSFNLNTGGGIRQFEFSFLQAAGTNFMGDPAFAVPPGSTVGGYLKYEGVDPNDIPLLVPGASFSFSNSSFKGGLSVVPEPACGLGALMMVGMAGMRTRRKQKSCTP